ncbi:MAG: rod shape-determining protein MreC [Gammaproteobacteria bacterium]|nr:MAG: rod shape-determining protein MreC [Gammaproteobacteria bacterium]
MTITCLVLAVVMMVFDYQGRIPQLRATIQQYISVPVKQAATWPDVLGDHIADFFTSKSDLQAENAKLKREIVWLKANLANQTVLEAEYRRLKSLFESTATHTRPVMIAEVLDSFIDANKHQIEINKGQLDKVFIGQIAIDQNGVVGQITSLAEKTAGISLITDERQRIPVFVERNRLRMLARGSGKLGELEMEFVDKTADVRVGDKVVTSGLGDRYPRGYGIAKVTMVEASPANEFLQVKAEPLAALDRILEVLLISSEPATEESAYDTER